MNQMIVSVRDKMLRRIGGVNHFVTHNKDYEIQFQFDDSWADVRHKMAVFAYEDGEYGSEIFDGDVCGVPELPREGKIYVGVKAGDELSTELLCVQVCKSADDVITDEYDVPDPKIYEQILDIMNNLWGGGDTVYPSSVKFLASPSTAKVGDLIRVKEVDENGDVTQTEGFDVGVELKKKIDAPQTAAVGEVLTVEGIGEDGKPKKWKTAPAAAEQVQADWNQNDEAAADYVRNRPFYTEIIEKTFESNADNKYINFEGIPFKAGDNVDIMVDGERLTLVAQSYNPAIVYIGDSFNELSGGTGQYGWTYYYVEQENLSVIESSGNHIFVYREPKIHKMEMKYSPVKLMSENAGEKYSIDRLYISENIDSKGLVLYYDEEEERYTLAAHDNNMNCSTTLYLAGNKNITDILNQEKEFEVSGYDIKSICENDLLNFQYYRIVIDAFVLNNRGYYVVISTTDDNQYTSNSLAGTKHYIGTFATVEGYLYKAELEIQCEDGDRTKFKSGKIKVKRIL